MMTANTNTAAAKAPAIATTTISITRQHPTHVYKETIYFCCYPPKNVYHVCPFSFVCVLIVYLYWQVWLKWWLLSWKANQSSISSLKQHLFYMYPPLAKANPCPCSNWTSICCRIPALSSTHYALLVANIIQGRLNWKHVLFEVNACFKVNSHLNPKQKTFSSKTE